MNNMCERVEMDSRLNSIVGELLKHESKGRAQYEIGERSVSYFHTSENKDLANVYTMVNKMIEPYLHHMIMLTSNEDTFKVVQEAIVKKNGNVSEDVIGVRLVKDIYSTAPNSVDIIYGDVVWSNLENGQCLLTFPSGGDE